MEKAYDFRKKLLTVHEPGLRERERMAREGEFFMPRQAVIAISQGACEVIETAARDFADFLQVSMGIAARVERDAAQPAVTVALASEQGVDLGEAARYRGFLVETDREGIRVYGHDARGAAQGLYYLEDVMSLDRTPAVPYGKVWKKPMFSPQMVHSGYGLDQYPDEHLARIAHEGRDAILVFTKDVNQTPDGYLDFNELIGRAARYGLDVYAYSYLVSEMSPEAPEAEEYYDNSYGSLFRECPGLKGVTLVGESVEFPSKDPNVGPGRHNQSMIDGVPTGKHTSGWWPCEDYPVWLNMIKKVIRKYKADADIVFWTYNWGSRPKEARLKLIETLPTDITLQVTFEMFEKRKYGQAMGHISDYTLAFEGPGEYFSSEAQVAKKRGLRLYSMTNTGGLAWDMGVIPYEPMPYQWIKRYEAMRKAQDDWGLCGIMETHHYGIWPSFVTKLSKWCFWEPRGDMEEILQKILMGTFGQQHYEKVDGALRCFSEAITYFTPNDADQYGAFRVGPSYPFNLERTISIPSDPKAMFGSRICFPFYSTELHPFDSPVSIRVPEELKSLGIMQEKMNQGVALLESIPLAGSGAAQPDAEELGVEERRIADLLNLGRFMCRCVESGVHAKEWHLMKCRMLVEEDRDALARIFDEMERILRAEKENAARTIPLVEQDSRLGWEPSMLYITDRWHLEWKIRQVDFVLNHELELYRSCLDN